MSSEVYWLAVTGNLSGTIEAIGLTAVVLGAFLLGIIAMAKIVEDAEAPRWIRDLGAAALVLGSIGLMLSCFLVTPKDVLMATAAIEGPEAAERLLEILEKRP